MINVNLIKEIHPTLMNDPLAELFPLSVINWPCESGGLRLKEVEG